MEVEEELEALEATFSGEIKCEKSTSGRTFTVRFSQCDQEILTLQLNEEYPSKLPTVVVSRTLQSLGLKEHVLAAVPPDSAGTPVLYLLVDAARQWVSDHPMSVQHTPPPESPTPGGGSKRAEQPKVPLCKFFLQGKCRFGDKCKNSHSKGGGPVPKRTITSESDNTKKTSKQRFTTKATSENKEGVEKKAPMRTADEVISRILWDPDLPSSEFKIGYLDRFVGVIEKPFSSFSWEDLATVGINVLAVPKHRIQYFKYKEEIVWDKPTQTDNFFGSRGGKLIQDIIGEDGVNVKYDPSKDESAEETLDETELVEVEVEEEEEEESGADHLSRVLADRTRPTHFICIRITDPRVHSKVSEIQSYVTKYTPALAEACLPISALHVTLCMVRLVSDEQMATARRVMKDIRLQLVHMLPRSTQLKFTGVSNFRQRLVYAKVDPCSALDHFVFFLMEQLQEAGLATPGNHKEYTAHMTLVKLSRPMQRDPHTSMLTPSMYEPFADHEIGLNRIESLSLCSVTAPKQADGFYLRLCEVTNSLSSLSSHFSASVVHRVNCFANSGVSSDEECYKLITSIKTSAEEEGNEEEFDRAIDEIISLGQEDTNCALTAGATQSPAVVVLRGVPGSGKSFLAVNSSEYLTDSTQMAICSADYYFMRDGEYKFSVKQLPKAHTACLDLFLQALSEGKQLIVVDNTNSRKWEYEIYRYLATVLGCRYHVLEVPCPSEKILETYRSRNQHRIDEKTAQLVFKRWEVDESALLVPPFLAYPRTIPTRVPDFSLLSICSSSEEEEGIDGNLSQFENLKVIYSAVFLTPESQWQLTSAVPPTHPKISTEHITLAFDPDKQSILDANIGSRVTLRVTGTLDDGQIQVAVVDLPHDLVSQNLVPHVTISAQENVSFKTANNLLQRQKPKPLHQVVELEGIVCVVVRERNELDDKEKGSETTEMEVSKQSTISQPTFIVKTEVSFRNHVLPKLGSFGQEAELLVGGAVDICTSVQKTTRLYIFDFDDTLFATPDARVGRRAYENFTGKKWRRKGWFSWAESLLPPLVSTPGPALPTFRDHVNQAGSITLILTGRNERTRSGVQHVLDNHGVYPDKLILKPDSPEEDTAAFKSRTVQKFLQTHPDITQVKFWDDNSRNLAALHRLSMSSTFKHIQFETIDATKMLPTVATKQGKKTKVQASDVGGAEPRPSMESYLFSCGHLSSKIYKSAAECGIRFIAERFGKMIGYSGNPLHLVYPFGSFPLGRRGDVDLCLLSPPHLTPTDALEQLYGVLSDCGITYIHKGYSTRCPRLKIMLELSNSPSIDFDVVFASIADEGFFSTSQSSQVSADRVVAKILSDDQVSKTAFSGAVLLHGLLQRINGVVPVSQFGAVVEMTVQTLIAQRQKGNAFHCIRTFHVVKLLSEFIKLDGGKLKGKGSDQIFKEYVEHVAELSDENWKKLFGEFVPFEFIPRVRKVFERSAELAELDSGVLPVKCCRELTHRNEVYPPEGHTLVEINLSGSNKIALWRLGAIVEARFPSYARQIISEGLDILPDGNVENKHRFTFAVPHTKSTKQKLQQILRPFWNEISKFRNEEGVSISLTFGKSHEDQNLGPENAREEESIPAIRELLRFASDPTEKELLISSSLTSYERMLVHEKCEQLGLNHSTVIIRKDKQILVKK